MQQLKNLATKLWFEYIVSEEIRRRPTHFSTILALPRPFFQAPQLNTNKLVEKAVEEDQIQEIKTKGTNEEQLTESYVLVYLNPFLPKPQTIKETYTLRFRSALQKAIEEAKAMRCASPIMMYISSPILKVQAEQLQKEIANRIIPPDPGAGSQASSIAPTQARYAVVKAEQEAAKRKRQVLRALQRELIRIDKALEKKKVRFAPLTQRRLRLYIQVREELKAKEARREFLEKERRFVVALRKLIRTLPPKKMVEIVEKIKALEKKGK